MIVRISKGKYPTTWHTEVTARLAESAKTLIPAITAMEGCLSYYVGADEASATMINVSVWDTLEHAQAMGSLAPMLSLAQEFTAVGVEFERPIINYATTVVYPLSISVEPTRPCSGPGAADRERWAACGQIL